MAAGAGAGLVLAIWGSLRCRATVGGTAGEPGRLLDYASPVLETISPLRGLRPQRLAALAAFAAFAAFAVVVATTLFTAHAERSLVEGLEHGGSEALFTVAGLTIVRGVGRLRTHRGPGPVRV